MADTYRAVTPYLVAPDADAELEFMKTAFGAVQVLCERNADNTIMHAEVRIGDSLVMLGQAGGEWKALKRCIVPVDRRCGWRIRQGAFCRSNLTERSREQAVRSSQCRRHRSGRDHMVDRVAGVT